MRTRKRSQVAKVAKVSKVATPKVSPAKVPPVGKRDAGYGAKGTGFKKEGRVSFNPEWKRAGKMTIREFRIETARDRAKDAGIAVKVSEGETGYTVTVAGKVHKVGKDARKVASLINGIVRTRKVATAKVATK